MSGTARRMSFQAYMRRPRQLDAPILVASIQVTAIQRSYRSHCMISRS